MNKRTPIDDVNHKMDIMEHVNQDHVEELIALTQDYVSSIEITSALIKDIYQEGALVEVLDAQQSQKDVFVPFQLDGDLEEQILYLAYAAMIKQGKELGNNRNQFFEVMSNQALTKNILRLQLKSAMPFTDNSPALAYLFSLKTLENLPEQSSKQLVKPKQSKLNHLVNRFFLWLMKQLSSKNRRRLLESMNKGTRYYTLRKVWRSSEESEFCDRGFVDVYLHGSTPGSDWARKLKAGDIIRSQNEAKDKHENLHQGQAILVADETAYPALASILEHWQNPKAPHVFILSTQEAEQAYFEDDFFPESSQVTRIVCDYKQQGEKVIERLKAIDNIETAWGALENESAKAIRYYLRNERQLKGKSNRIKAYWRANKGS